MVYATCGEQWIDPELTKAEQQRRLLLAYLSYDVRMIYFYCALRYPAGKNSFVRFILEEDFYFDRICRFDGNGFG